MIRLLSTVALILLLTPLTAWTDDKNAESKIADEENSVLDLTNKERAKENLPPLKLNTTLSKVARAHSENMAKQGKMAHELDGKTPFNRVSDSGYRFNALGENVAHSGGSPVEKIIEGWMASPQHRGSILSKDYTEIGIGVARKGDELYYTQVFARPGR